MLVAGMHHSELYYTLSYVPETLLAALTDSEEF